ncbi:MAG: nucleotidyltransferase domain-containing protein [Enterococcus malodoratus]|uniref:nucleotidyltransferase domain-containing protein n=1 Tax=Enterococcus malodoratus TaxID=71451 RepID=UPI0020733A9F|nr:aminoglycoside adenylyltransferase [Enterococcus malodoratus]
MKSKDKQTESVSKESFLMIIDLLTDLNIRYWVEGGWGIDVLIGKQTREHQDVDIDFDATHEKELLKKLSEIGYQITIDQRPTRVELYHPNYGNIDIHPFEISESGSVKQANPEGGWFELASDWFTKSSYEGRMIPCVSIEGQRIFHSGYDLRAVDHADLSNLNAAYPQVSEN